MSTITAIVTCLFLTTIYGGCCKARTVPAGIDYEPPQALMSRVEMEALFEVMQAIAVDKNWKTVHPHPCSEDIWPGLVCEQGDDGLLHVTRLDFGYRPNPPCRDNATIPSALAKLSYLQCLFVFQCFTSSNTTIPREIAQIVPSLQQLSLRANNGLVGEIPSELGNLGALEVLSLSQNSLEGSIPRELGKLSNLRRLDLSYNKLSGKLPDELSNLKNLVIFDLSVNLLRGELSPSLGNLTALQKLDLSFNFLHGTLPRELGNLASLEFLAASDNFIQGPFPESLSRLTDLQYLIMDNNPMNAPLPKFLGTFPKMLAMTLSNSGYVGQIPEDVCRLANLTVLSLNRNNLTGSIPGGLADLRHIYELNLSENLLSGPIPFSPGFVRRLGRNLNLKGNVGLCSHWSFPENTQETSLRLCADPASNRHRNYVRSAARALGSHGSIEALKNQVKAAIYVSIACLQLL